MHVVKRDKLTGTIRNTTAFHFNAAWLQVASRLRATSSSRHQLQETVEQFNQKNVVLTVTAGRTGTDTFSRLFQSLPDTSAQHEPNPNHRFILHRIQSRPKEAAWFFWYLQARALVSRPGGNVVESSHLFCKGFFEPCIAAGFRPSLLMLTRDTRTTALSHLRKNAVPGRTGPGYRYLIAPTDSVYLPVEDPDTLTDYQLCYWYCLEMELRQLLYAELADQLGMPAVWLKTNELSDMNRLVETAVALELGSEDAVRAALTDAGVGQVHNASRGSKAVDQASDLDAEETSLRERLGRPSTLEDVNARIEQAKAYL